MTEAPLIVSGATGYLGRQALHELADCGQRVIALGRDAATLATLPVAVETRTCTIRQPLGAERINGLRGGILFHLAGEARRSYGASTSAQGALEYAETICESAVRAGISRVVVASSIYARLYEEDVTTEYGAHKLAIERAFRRRSEFATLILRLPPVYGGRGHGAIGALADLVRRGVPLPLGQAREKRSYLSIHNLSALLAALARADPTVWEGLSGLVAEPADGPPVSTRELLEIIGEALGRKPRLISVPPTIMIALASIFGKGEAVRAAFMPLEARSDEQLRSLSGWVPQPLSVGTFQVLRSD